MQTELIRRISIRGSAEGVDQAAASVNKLAAAQKNLAVVSDEAAGKTLSMERRLESIQRRFDTNYRSTQDLAKVQRDLDRSVAQGIVTQGRANDLMRAAGDHFGRSTGAQRLWSQGLQAANDNLQTFASRLGPVGSGLASLGPAGLAAAAGIGAAAVATAVLVKEVNALADRAGKMVDFAETTGLTTTQLQALQKAAAGVGIDTDKVGTGFERFSVQMEELRRGSGDLFTAMNRIDPTLTNQLASTRDLGEAWDVFAVALSRANRELGNAAAKAAFGRTGIPFTRLAGATNEAGGIAGLEAGLGRVNTLTKEQLTRWDQLKDQIDITAKTARDNIVSIFADDVLQAQLGFYQTLLQISQAAKDFTLSPELRSLLDKAAMVGRILMRGGRGGSSAGDGPIGPMPPAAASFADRFGAFSDRVTTKPEFDAARLKQRVDVLGSAASATMRLALAEAELAIKAKAAGVSQEDLARGIAALRLDNTIALEQKRISLLGEMASVDSIVIAKQNEINLARMQGVRITKEEAAAIIERTRIQADAAKLESQLNFERAQMFRTATDARVAETLRAQGISAGSARGQNVAEMIRFNEQLKLSIDLSTEFATGFVRDMRQGATALQALTNALNRLADRLLDMAINQLVKSALGGLSGGGWLGSSGAGGLSGVVSGGAGVVAHSGGIIGQTALPQRYIHPAYFDDAPRYHSGGLAGLAPDEVPAILQRGERVIPKGGASGGQQINVTVAIDLTGHMTKESVAQVARAAAAQGVKEAVSIANAGAPGRQQKFNLLGT